MGNTCSPQTLGNASALSGSRTMGGSKAVPTAHSSASTQSEQCLVFGDTELEGDLVNSKSRLYSVSNMSNSVSVVTSGGHTNCNKFSKHLETRMNNSMSIGGPNTNPAVAHTSPKLIRGGKPVSSGGYTNYKVPQQASCNIKPEFDPGGDSSRIEFKRFYWSFPSK